MPKKTENTENTQKENPYYGILLKDLRQITVDRDERIAELEALLDAAKWADRVQEVFLDSFMRENASLRTRLADTREDLANALEQAGKVPSLNSALDNNKYLLNRTQGHAEGLRDALKIITE